MKASKAVVAMLTLSALSLSPAWSADRTKTNAGDDWAQHVQRQSVETPPMSGPANSAATLFGSVAPATMASRSITLTPGMRYVNVDSGETVQFQSGGQATAWTFAEFIHGTSVDLGVILPDMPNAKGVQVYIDRSSLYSGG